MRLPASIQTLWDQKPLRLILLLAAIPRLLAVLFAKGYGMHDDHFLVIEVAQSWVEGFDVFNWFPSDPAENSSGRSYLYPGFHYLLFGGLEGVGMGDPQAKMYVVRLVHALYSLLTVTLTFHLAKRMGGLSVAKRVGLLCALFWGLAPLSVRNLVEVVAIPVLLAASLCTLNGLERKKLLPFLWAGIWLGIAFSVRYQTIFFAGGLGLAVLIGKRWWGALLMAVGTVLPVALIHGLGEYWLWGQPFGKLVYYVQYNLTYQDSYTSAPWYNYLLLLGGLFLFPVGLFYLFGVVRAAKKHLWLFLPVFFFLAFHSYFPNKQERFVFTLIPFWILLGELGWSAWLKNSNWWAQRPKILRGSWVFFWVINTILLVVTCTSYGKRARTEAVYSLTTYPEKVNGILIVDADRHGTFKPPLFYSREWPHVEQVHLDRPMGDFLKQVPKLRKKGTMPNVLMIVSAESDPQIPLALDSLGNWQKHAVAEPGLFDKILYTLNPVNYNVPTHVFVDKWWEDRYDGAKGSN